MTVGLATRGVNTLVFVLLLSRVSMNTILSRVSCRQLARVRLIFEQSKKATHKPQHMTDLNTRQTSTPDRNTWRKTSITCKTSAHDRPSIHDRSKATCQQSKAKQVHDIGNAAGFACTSNVFIDVMGAVMWKEENCRISCLPAACQRWNGREPKLCTIT